MRRIYLPITWVILAALPACTVGPNYVKPDFESPKKWSRDQGKAEGNSALSDWWQSFNDPVLSKLIRKAIEGNLDLRIATQRIREARSLIEVTASADRPHVGLGALAESRRQTQSIDWPPPVEDLGEYPYYQIGVNASWELDLFGETRRRKEAAVAGAESSIETRRGILVSLTSEVATHYAAYRAAGIRLGIARENRAIAERTLGLAKRAFEAGQQSHFEVSQAETQFHAVNAAIPAIQAQADNALHAIAILLGEAPQTFSRDDLAGETAIPVPPPLPASLPSEVIALRPDIRKAERDYAQANAKVGVATAAKFPHFTIPLFIGPAVSDYREFFKQASLLWNLGPGVTQSVYSGGKLDAQVEQAEANKEAELIVYRQTVLKAFGEVEDALSNQAAERASSESVKAQVSSARRALNEATDRYENGQIGYLPVLDSQRQLQVAQEASAAHALRYCLASISLYKSLGGGWHGVRLPEASPQPERKGNPG